MRASKGEGPRRPFKAMILLLAGLLLLILLVVIILPRSRRSNEGDRYASLMKRMGRLDEKLEGLDALEKKVSLLEEQNTKFAISIMDRVDRLEKSMMFRMGHLEKAEEPKTSAPRPVSQSASQEQEKPVYHVVKPGENIYRIGLKYGLSTDEVRKMNKLAPNGVIYVGQKLIVGRGSRN